jgi:hypothetical protein
MLKMKRSMIAAMSVVAVLAISSAAQATIIIDDFTSPAGGWTLTTTTIGVPVTQSETGLAGVYGGSRDTVYTVGGMIGGTSWFGTSTSIEPGVWFLSNSTKSWSKGTLTYNGGGGAGGLNLNLTSGTQFSFDALFDHVGASKNSVLSLTLNDGLQAATVSKVWTSVDPIPPAPQTFSFAAFLSGNPSLNLSSIDSISVYLETDRAGDYEIHVLSTDAVVPEPGTIALLATGLIGLLAYAWRRRRS